MTKRPRRRSATGQPFGAALDQLAATWAQPVTPDQARALEDYAALLLTWSARINLTAAQTPDELVTRHFSDAFALAGLLPAAWDVVDVGSGGGLPALPLALLRPDLRIRLVEPTAKKAAFLRTAVRELRLGERVSVDAMRAEALAARVARSFDAAISRAAMAPVDWVRLAQQLVRPGGRIVVLTSHADALAGVPTDDAGGLALRARRSYDAGRRWVLELEPR